MHIHLTIFSCTKLYYWSMYLKSVLFHLQTNTVKMIILKRFNFNAISRSTVLPAVVQVTPTPQPSNYVYAKHYGNEGYARIIEQDSDTRGRSYQYKFKTENGIAAGESGVVDPSLGGTRVSGFYEYVGADGLTYRVDYTADENGFHPTGAHLPK